MGDQYGLTCELSQWSPAKFLAKALGLALLENRSLALNITREKGYKWQSIQKIFSSVHFPFGFQNSNSNSCGSTAINVFVFWLFNKEERRVSAQTSTINACLQKYLYMQMWGHATGVTDPRCE